jgi:hypothetical protein
VEVFKTSGAAARYAAQERRGGRSTATKKEDLAFNALSVRVWVVLVRDKAKAAAE